jgi:hypothetical protein
LILGVISCIFFIEQLAAAAITGGTMVHESDNEETSGFPISGLNEVFAF